jgi:hypothetical protein
MTLRLAQDRDQVVEGMHDIVAGRLFSAGLALEAVAGLLGDHRAAGKGQEAISELDLAVRDLRDMVFDHYRPDLPAAGRRGQGVPGRGTRRRPHRPCCGMLARVQGNAPRHRPPLTRSPRPPPTNPQT